MRYRVIMPLASSLASPVESLLRLYARVAVTERGGYRLARLARRVQPREHWRRRFHTPQGATLDLDLGVYPDCCMAYGLYEVSVRRAIERVLRPGDHFVDAGANIGVFTLLAARLVGDGGRVDAFEPEPHNRGRLVDHLRINHVGQWVRVHEAALADAAGEAWIHFLGEAAGGESGANHGCSTLYPGPTAANSGAAGADATRVRTVRLDDVLQGTRPRLIKMDIEGAEAAAVEGMAGLLTTDSPPTIIGEVNPSQAAAAGVAPSQWVRRAVAMQPRYRVYRLGVRPTLLTDLDELDTGGQQNVLLRVA